MQAPKQEEKEDPCKPIPLLPVTTDEAKNVQGTQWKNAQLLIYLRFRRKRPTANHLFALHLDSESDRSHVEGTGLRRWYL
jgi:hypothetical protein